MFGLGEKTYYEKAAHSPEITVLVNGSPSRHWCHNGTNCLLRKNPPLTDRVICDVKVQYWVPPAHGTLLYIILKLKHIQQAGNLAGRDASEVHFTVAVNEPLALLEPIA